MRLLVYLLDHTSDHLLGRIKVCDYAISQGTHGADILVPLLVNLSSLQPHGDDFIVAPIESYNTRLVKDDLAILHYYSISCAEVHSQFLSQFE